MVTVLVLAPAVNKVSHHLGDSIVRSVMSSATYYGAGSNKNGRRGGRGTQSSPLISGVARTLRVRPGQLPALDEQTQLRLESRFLSEF